MILFDQQVFDNIRTEYQQFVSRLDIPDLHFIPISALHGDNVVDTSEKMPWYNGNTLMSFLESVYIGSDRNLQDFRMPVQMVLRPDLDFRGFSGTIASGIVRSGDEVMVLPSGKTTRVKSIETFDGSLKEAFAPLAVTLTLEDEIDCSRGDMIVRPGNVPKQQQKLSTMIVWMSEEPMVPGKQYLFKQTTRMITGTVSTLRYQVDVNTLHRENAPTLGLNEIGRCDISLSEPVSFDSYQRNRATGSFIVIDRISNSTVAAGMILDRTAGTRQSELWDDLDQYQRELQDSTSAVETNEREARFGQKPVTLLLTGLTGAGKTSLAYALERRLFDMGRAAMVLDGQNLRRGISKDLGFTAEDRSENLRRSAEVAQLMNNAGLICIAALVAPSEEIRQRAAETIGNDRFLVIHVHAPLEVCRERDTSGIYEKVDRGEIRNFPGVSATYEEPVDPALRVETEQLDVGQCVDQIVQLLESRDILSSS